MLNDLLVWIFAKVIKQLMKYTTLSFKKREWLAKGLDNLYLLTRNTYPNHVMSGSENPATNCVLLKQPSVSDNLTSGCMGSSCQLSAWTARDQDPLSVTLSTVLLTISPPLSQSRKACFSMWCSASHWACIFLSILSKHSCPCVNVWIEERRKLPLIKHTAGVSAKTEC